MLTSIIHTIFTPNNRLGWKMAFINKFLFLSYLLFIQGVVIAQSRWEDHFNYALVQEIHQIGNKLYCVSSNALFTYDLESKELEKISKVNLLNGVKPTSVAYNESLDYLLVGYANGELDLLGEESENFIEIPLDDYTGSKKINHLSTAENIMLISAAYGVSIFDLEKREFAETAFFRKNGNYITVNESEIFDGYIFSASENGIYSHLLNELLPNFNNWTLAQGLPAQNFEHIQKFGDKLLASSGGNLYVLDNGKWSIVGNYENIQDLNVNENHLIVSTSNQVWVLNESFQNVVQTSFNSIVKSGIFSKGLVFAGTKKDGLVNSNYKAEHIYPDGPYSNNAYYVTAQDHQIWVAPGGQINYNEPTNNEEGYFHFNGIKWKHISSKQLNNAKDIIHVAYNPKNLNQSFAASWHYNYNLYEVIDDESVKEYNAQNTAPNGIVENFYSFGQVTNLGGSAFDDAGNLFISQAYIDQGREFSALIKKTPSNEWYNILFDKYHVGSPGITKPVIGKNGYVWLGGTRGDGVLVTDMENTFQILSGEDKGDLPSNYVYAIEIDDYGTAWIGTSQGLRIKRSPIANLEKGDFDTEPVVIVQNGIPEALLTDTSIKDITQDSSNRKWIATQGAGAFYIAESGKEIIHHFTEDESPLASDVVNAIAVDSQTGKVYFATELGLVSYQGDAVDTGESFGEIIAYPNPIRPGYEGNVTIKGLARNTEVRITDVVGNLIYEDKEAGGIVQWNQRNLKGQKVASGVYIVMLIAGDGLEKATTKIAIVR